MGNEMGNSNTTEKDNTAVEGPQEPSKETAVANDVKEGNETAPAAADTDFHEKANGLASDDQENGDLCADKQTSSKGVGSNEEDGGSSENKPASLSNGTEHDDLIEPDMEKTVPESIENQLQKQISMEKEEEGTKNSELDAISESQGPQPEKPAQSDCDQQELGTVHAEASVADGRGSSGDTDGDLGCISMENGNLSDTIALAIQEASIETETVTVTEKEMDDKLVEENKLQDEKELCKDDVEAKDGDIPENGMSNVTTPPSVLSSLDEKNEGFSTEASSNGTDSSESEPETTLVTNSPNPHQEAPETEEKHMILKKESRPVGEEGENGEYKHDQNPTQSVEELVTEPETGASNAFQSESIIVEQKEAANHCSDSDSNMDFLTEEPKLAEKDDIDVSCISSQDGVFEEQRKDSEGDVVIVSKLGLLPSESTEKDDIDVSCISSQNGVFEEQRKDSEGHVVIVAELGFLASESTITDCNHKGDESPEWKIVEDQKEENLEPLYAIEIETGGTQVAEQNPLPVDQAEAVPPPQHLQQESALGSETVQSNNFGEFLPAKASTFDSTNLIAKIVVSGHELVVTQLIEIPQVTAKEADISPNRSYAFPSCNGSEARESAGRLSIASMERLSTDSDPDNLNLHAHMRKSPSFNLNLQNEESDQTPLLYEDKAEIQSSPRQSDVSLGNTTIQNGYTQDLLQKQAMPVEEKVVTLERSDSEKSKTPFLGLLKEEKESFIVGARKETKDLWKSPSRESASSSPKGKEKRRARSSLFGNCLCCATEIN